jgi:hypothetical protein
MNQELDFLKLVSSSIKLVQGDRPGAVKNEGEQGAFARQRTQDPKWNEYKGE